MIKQSIATMQPSLRYQADIDAKLIQRDVAQAQVVQHLDRLYQELLDTTGSAPGYRWPLGVCAVLRRLIPTRLLPIRPYPTRLGRRRWPFRPNPQSPQGLYIWGSVGRGKTWLMDIFFDCLPTTRKRRTHFYRFMQEIHQGMAELEGDSEPLSKVAANIAKTTDVLCFDEFFVVDIGDAMILSGLLDALFAAGVVLVTTSNVPPDGLYENGLQRERFLPAIALLKRNLETVEIKAGIDYRLQHLSNSELYHSPLDDSVHDRLLACFRGLVPDQAQIQEQQPLDILGRSIQSVACAKDVVWFDFTALCTGPRSAFDYVEIARLHHAVIVSDVPQLTDDDSEAARRFISLIDELYDRRVKLILSAAVPPSELYTGTGLAFEFERTRSRLLEMQSLDYLGSSHRIQGTSHDPSLPP